MTLNMFACSPNPPKDSLKVEWQPGINAPTYYPIETVFGGFYADNRYCGIASGVLQWGGWGQPGAEMSSGFFVPDSLTIGWFSFAEDKFYRGDFKLPSDTMRALFKQGYVDRKGKFFRYNTLIVNVYPKGGVALWMQIGGRRNVEIAHFQGEEMDYDWHKMYPPDTPEEKKEYLKAIMDRIEGGAAYLAKHGVSQEPFKTVYRPRYNYTIKIDSVSHEDTEFNFPEFYNGEMDCMEGKELENIFFKTKATPKQVYFRWLRDDVVYFGEIFFDEEEIFNAFAEITGSDSDVEFVMHLKPNFATRKLHVSLRSENKEIELQQTGVMGKSSSQRFAEEKEQKNNLTP